MHIYVDQSVKIEDPRDTVLGFANERFGRRNGKL